MSSWTERRDKIRYEEKNKARHELLNIKISPLDIFNLWGFEDTAEGEATKGGRGCCSSFDAMSGAARIRQATAPPRLIRSVIVE